MRRSEFTERSPGQLVDLEDGVAFTPDVLPPSLAPDWTLQSALTAASSAVGELLGQSRHRANQAIFTQPLMYKEAGESARIEGTQTRIADVLLQKADVLPADPYTAASNLEVLRYVEALGDGRGWIDDGRPFSLFLLRSLHETILKGTRGSNKHPGQLRQQTVVVGRAGGTPGTAAYVPPPF